MFLVQVIPFDEWPDEFFPTNCWGVVYIMSQFVRNKLIQVKIWAVQWLLTFANECCLQFLQRDLPPHWSLWLLTNKHLKTCNRKAQTSLSFKQPLRGNDTSIAGHHKTTPLKMHHQKTPPEDSTIEPMQSKSTSLKFLDSKYRACLFNGS